MNTQKFFDLANRAKNLFGFIAFLLVLILVYAPKSIEAISSFDVVAMSVMFFTYIGIGRGFAALVTTDLYVFFSGKS